MTAVHFEVANPEELRVLLASVAEDGLTLTNTQLADIANRALLGIKRRTLRGIDYQGQAFAPYAASYVRFRIKKGRQTSPVNLSFSGVMLNALRGGAFNGAARVTITGDAGRIANFHNSNRSRRKLPQRRFLDVDTGTPLHDTLSALAVRFLRERLEAEWAEQAQRTR
jgi:hypothetical protein